MKKLKVLAGLSILVLFPLLASADGLMLNGLGTRAQAMGGAYVGIANDFSAVFWNPAGAAGFRQEMFGFAAVDLMPRVTYRQWPLTLEVPIIDARTPTSHYLNFLGAYYRPVGPKIVIGLGISTPSGFGTTWNGEELVGDSGGTAFSWSSRYRLLAVSPLIAVELTRWLSVGATVNVQYGTIDLEMRGGVFDQSGELVYLQYEENTNGWGFGAAFGVLAKPIKELAIGLTFRTASTVSYKGTARMPGVPSYGLPETSELRHTITWPLWIAGGVSFRPLKGLLLSADLQWTQWSEMRQNTQYLDVLWQLNIPYSYEGQRLFGLPHFFGKNTTQLRFGVECALDATTALRAGFYRDPSPGPSPGPILFPAHDFNAFTAGVGKTIGALQLDLGLEYLAGNEWSADFGSVGHSQRMNIVIPSVSVQYKF